MVALSQLDTAKRCNVRLDNERTRVERTMGGREGDGGKSSEGETHGGWERAGGGVYAQSGGDGGG